MGINFGQVKTEVEKVLDDLLADEALKRDIVYRKFSGQSFDDTLGHNVNIYTNTTIASIKLKHNEDSVKQFVGDIQAGDVVYVIKFSSAPVGLSLRDLINDGSETGLKVKSLKDIFEIAWAITVGAT